MTQSAAPVVTRGLDAVGARIDAEKLECYHVAQEMRVLVVGVLPGASRAARDQLDRASLSVVLNIAEAMCSHYLREATGCSNSGLWAPQVAEATSILSPRRLPLVTWT